MVDCESRGPHSKRGFAMKRSVGMFLAVLLSASSSIIGGCATPGASPAPGASWTASYVTYAAGEHPLRGRLCRPRGAGPFPVVVYNHGGFQGKMGGAPDETCAALAKAGFVGFSPIRELTLRFRGQAHEVETAIDYAVALPYVDPARLGVIGFSSGATVTYMVAARRPGLKAVVIMGTAGVERRMGIDPSAITAPVLVLVAKNDTGSRLTRGNDTLVSSEYLVAALKQAGRDVTYIVYPPYRSDGHRMFFEVGAYWNDVVGFLKQHL